MNFLQTIFEQLRQDPSKPILQEVKDRQLVPTSCEELLDNVARARRFFIEAGLTRGDRCALLAPNSSRWVALDLAIMAEGGVTVPLYSRQSVDELVAILKDSTPRWICCSDRNLAERVSSRWPNASAMLLFDKILGDSGRILRGAAVVHARRIALFSDAAALAPSFTSSSTFSRLNYRTTHPLHSFTLQALRGSQKALYSRSAISLSCCNRPGNGWMN